jgi:hypothetical protein
MNHYYKKLNNKFVTFNMVLHSVSWVCLHFIFLGSNLSESDSITDQIL